jgi:hypothetical protein
VDVHPTCLQAGFGGGGAVNPVVDELLFGGGGEFGKLGRIENGEVAALGIRSEFGGVRFFGFELFLWR